MFCPECGKELKGTEKYCPSCGHPVASEEEAGRQTHLENTEGHKKRKNKKKIAFNRNGTPHRQCRSGSRNADPER